MSPGEGSGGVIQVGGDVAMREHHSLGIAGGARGIDKRGQILRLDRKAAQPAVRISTPLRRRRHFPAETERAITLSVLSRPAIWSMTRMRSSCVWLRMDSDLAVLCLGRDHGDASAGIDQQVGDLLGGECGVDGHIDRAKHQGSEVDHWPLPAILCQQRDTVAFDNAPVEQRHWPGHTREPRARRWRWDATCRMHPATALRARACWPRPG